jgi:peptidoglycan LD-endopeptidase CwlK
LKKLINSRNINDLHPTLKRGAIELLKRLENLGLKPLITATFRDVEYQNSLYAKGRTASGSIVTNARGGESIHNYRLAFDLCKNVKGQEFSDLSFFNTAGEIWQDMGGEWGGNWLTFQDKPHFEFTNKLTLKELQNGKKMDDNTKMKWESIKVKKYQNGQKIP